MNEFEKLLIEAKLMNWLDKTKKIDFNFDRERIRIEEMNLTLYNNKKCFELLKNFFEQTKVHTINEYELDAIILIRINNQKIDKFDLYKRTNCEDKDCLACLKKFKHKIKFIDKERTNCFNLNKHLWVGKE